MGFFQLCRASADYHTGFAGTGPTLRERRQVGSGLGKQACLPLCLPFGFRFRFAHAIRFTNPRLTAAALRAGRVSLPLADRAGGILLAWAWVKGRAGIHVIYGVTAPCPASEFIDGSGGETATGVRIANPW